MVAPRVAAERAAPSKEAEHAAASHAHEAEATGNVMGQPMDLPVRPETVFPARYRWLRSPWRPGAIAPWSTGVTAVVRGFLVPDPVLTAFMAAAFGCFQTACVLATLAAWTGQPALNTAGAGLLVAGVVCAMAGGAAHVRTG